LFTTQARKLCRNSNILSPGSGTVAGVATDVDGVIDIDKVLDVDVAEVDTVRHAWVRRLSRCSARTSKSVTNM